MVDSYDKEYDLVCYVCMEYCQTLSPCRCENMYLHQQCYEKLLEYNNHHCTVCKEPYPHLEEHIVIEDTDEYSEFDEEDDEVYDKNALCCRILVPIQLRTIYVYKPSACDQCVNPFRHVAFVWLICVIWCQIIQDKNSTKAFFDVFQWYDFGNWAFATICYIFIFVLVEEVVKRRQALQQSRENN